ncbi:MAG: ABC transporter permease [Actinomycetales bacterium]
MSTVQRLTGVDLTGTRRLTRLAWRRDRYTLAAWWAGLGLFVAATMAMFERSLALHEDVVRETRIVATNAGMRLLGLTSGPTVGGYMLHREYVTLAVLAALLSTFAVIRHTRQNEELGRAEMLGSTVVGRHAGLAAGVLIAVAADIVLAVVLGVAIAVSGQPVGGALLAGASVAAVGLVWVGVAAVACQLSSTTRGAAGIAAGALRVAFALSGIGNMMGTVDQAGLVVNSAWPAWLSPIGWGQQTRPFGAAHWWPLLIALAALGILLATAVALASRRDVGRGLWPERRGHAQATRGLLSPAGLVWRLQRGAFIGWASALTIFGLIFGNLTEQIRGLEGHSKDWWIEAGGTEQVVDAYKVSIIQMAGMFVAIYLVQVLLRMRADETGGTLESILASGVTRTRWLAGHLVNAIAGSSCSWRSSGYVWD